MTRVYYDPSHLAPFFPPSGPRSAPPHARRARGETEVLSVRPAAKRGLDPACRMNGARLGHRARRSRDLAAGRLGMLHV